jgi:hypothetical protein
MPLESRNRPSWRGKQGASCSKSDAYATKWQRTTHITAAVMPSVIYFADPSNRRPGRGATILLDSGERCIVSLARTSVLVKARSMWFGAVLYKEENLYNAARTAAALTALFPESLLPPVFTDPSLSAFANAIMHCSTCGEVAVVCNEAIGRTEKLGIFRNIVQ